MAKRSPILGYNHNVRHRGLLFHVQTEDSGVDNPHIFTHLFHGGIILATRKLEYDRGSAEDVVKALMQAQHKASLRQLKAGEFDDKISAYLGDQPELQAPAPRTTTRDTIDSVRPPRTLTSHPPPPVAPMARSAEPGSGLVNEPSRTTRTDDVSAAFRNIKRDGSASGVQAPEPSGPRRRLGSQTGYSLHKTGQLEPIPESQDQSVPPAPRGKGRTPAVVSPVAPRPPASGVRPAGKQHTPPPIPPRPAGKSRTSPPTDPRAGVIVSRPAVIVGAPPRVVSPHTGEPPAPRAARRTRDDSRQLFGQDLISERSLDEVILAYLSEDSGEKPR